MVRTSVLFGTLGYQDWHQVQSLPDSVCSNSYVERYIHHSHRQWDEHLLRSAFLPFEVATILRKPIGEPHNMNSDTGGMSLQESIW